MNLSKWQKYCIVVLMAIGAALAGYIGSSFVYEKPVSVATALIFFTLILIVGIVLVKNNKEPYDAAADNCSQTINIYQNCGSKPGPGPGPSPGPVPIDKDAIKKWIASVDPKLTGQCQDCILVSASQLWSSDTLDKVSSMPLEKQKTILSALLAFDCEKQCVIPPSGLVRGAVDTWVHTVAPNVIGTCHDCAVDVIMKLWSPDDLKKADALSPADKTNIVMALLTVNCPDCDAKSGKLAEGEVRDWIDSLLSGAKKECSTCLVNKIVDLWDEKKMTEVKAMKKNSQQQILQALLALNCQKECIEIPSGLDAAEVMQWVTVVMPAQIKGCYDCAVDAVLRNWTPSIFTDVKNMPAIEQSKILQALVVLNCQICLQGGLARQQIVSWISDIYPELSGVCTDCIADKASSMWSKKDFTDLLAKDSQDQQKILKSIANFNCPHVCTV